MTTAWPRLGQDVVDWAQRLLYALEQQDNEISSLREDISNLVPGDGNGGDEPIPLPPFVSGIPEAPINNLTYGRINASWARVLAITEDVLDGGNF